MKVKPYVLKSIRSKLRWQAAADKLGVHVAILYQVFKDKGTIGSEFLDAIMSDSQEMFQADVKKAASECPLSLAECEAELLEIDRFLNDLDFLDLLNYRLKQIIRVGDEIVSYESKKYLSGRKYQSARRRYKISSLEDFRSDLSDFCAITNADIKGEKIYWCVHGIRSVWRKGKEIWNWHIAYHDLWVEQNPNHPETKKMEKQRDKYAAKARRGDKDV